MQSSSTADNLSSALGIARAYVGAGISVVPILRDGSKAAAISWKAYQGRLPTPVELTQWFGGPTPLGIATLGGDISGGLEQLDFDGDASNVLAKWRQLVDEEMPGLTVRLCIAVTPGGGYHVRYRCPDVDVPGNTNLAIDPTATGHGRTLIQTRGEGGYAIAPGSPAECHPTGQLYRHQSGPLIPPILSIDEREWLLTCARAMDRRSNELPKPIGADMRPGDVFEQQGPDWSEILTPHGWVCAYGPSTSERRWRRPGKEKGWSATTGRCQGRDGADLLRVFSSNAQPFEEGKAYGKFRAYTLLNHSGNFAAAADELARQGFRGNGRHTPSIVPVPSYIGGNRNDSRGGGVPERWKVVRCSELQKRPDAERWIWEGCIARGQITQLNALFKVGKTTLLAHLIRALGADGMFCGRPCKRAKILYVTEEGDDNWVDRRDELGLEDHIHFIRNPFLTKPSKREWLAFVEYIRQQVHSHGYDVVVFDTISNLWHVRDENNSCEVQEALMPLRSLPDTTALVIVHHLRKSDGAEGTAGRGSSAFGGYVDIILEIRRFNASEKGDNRRTLSGYGRPKSVPQEIVLSLSENGYELDGDKSEVLSRDLIPLLERLIPSDPARITRNELRDGIRDERSSGVKEEVFLAALRQGIDEGRWKQEGQRPIKYYREGK